jgi:hypothetical protein
MSNETKIENNGAVSDQTIVSIQSMSGNISVPPQHVTFMVHVGGATSADPCSLQVTLNAECYNLFVVLVCCSK